MADDLTRLNQLANQATKGVWMAVGGWVENVRDDLPDIVCAQWDEHRGPCDSAQQIKRDAEYIAAAQPCVIKALIKELRALRKLARQKERQPPCSSL